MATRGYLRSLVPYHNLWSQRLSSSSEPFSAWVRSRPCWLLLITFVTLVRATVCVRCIYGSGGLPALDNTRWTRTYRLVMIFISGPSCWREDESFVVSKGCFWCKSVSSHNATPLVSGVSYSRVSVWLDTVAERAVRTPAASSGGVCRSVRF